MIDYENFLGLERRDAVDVGEDLYHLHLHYEGTELEEYIERYDELFEVDSFTSMRAFVLYAKVILGCPAHKQGYDLRLQEEKFCWHFFFSKVV